MTIQQQFWNYFLAKGISPQGIAGMMGNVQIESGFKTNNLEDYRLPYSDEQYTNMVDNGSYSNFVNDGCGYGLVQWTYYALKQDLLNFCKSRNKSISDLSCQLEQLYLHLKSEGVYNTLKTINSVDEAAVYFMQKFEKPSAEAQAKTKSERIKYANDFYNQFKNNNNQSKGGNRMKYSVNNAPLVCMQTHSTCYQGTSKMTVKGVLWHSTGANNTTIKRYVQPSEDDGNYARLMALIGKNLGNNDWNHISIQAGLNAWIGTLADGTVAAVQTMPWDYKPWGCGSGNKGSCNNGWIQFEICEDNLNNRDYFNKVYTEACELTAYLCKLYGLNPMGSALVNGVNVPVILCHQDSYQLGLGSNHSDVYHWFTKYGKNMNTVRQDVMNILGGVPVAEIINTSPVVEPVNNGLIKKGEESTRVRELQQNLIKLGYSCGPAGADGDFGNGTYDAVIKFQRDHGLEVDGLVGNATLSAIQNELKKMNTTPITGLYRVRASWNDAKSQKGAFTNLDLAKKLCDSLSEEYKVFDSNGNIVYSHNKNNEPTTPVVIPQNQSNTKPRHTYATVMIGSSSKDERGQYQGGQAGDQTNKEVYILNWYYQNWNVVLRPTTDELAERIACAMEDACDNNNIGYDQLERNSLYTQAKQVGLNMSKITSPCECDCSSLVSICCICAGLPEAYFYVGGNMCTTRNLKNACLNTNMFSVLTDNKYLTQKDYLKRGDILLNESQHVVIVLADGANVEKLSPSNQQQNGNPYTPAPNFNGAYRVRIIPTKLNVRSQPDANSTITTVVRSNEVYTIVDERGGWGKLKSGAGWINLSYASKL